MAWPFTGFKQTDRLTDRQLDKYILDSDRVCNVKLGWAVSSLVGFG